MSEPTYIISEKDRQQIIVELGHIPAMYAGRLYDYFLSLKPVPVPEEPAKENGNAGANLS